MVVVPVVDEGLGNSSYLVDLGDGGALVVDPQRDPRPYLRALERRGLAPRFVVETHLHADFVSGGRELMAAGAELLAPKGSALRFPHRPLVDGEELDLGGLSLQVIATPGHTPEHLAYLLRDGDLPLGLFSGGTLMVGGVARTDLLSPELTEELARAAFRSIRQRLFTLPEELQVYPTHGAGSFCSAGGPGGSGTTTIGQEKRSHPLLADDPDEETFVARLVGSYRSFPPYFLELREVNRAGAGVYGPRPPRPEQLTPEQLEAKLAAGAVLVDVRPIGDFAAAHIPSALSISWRSQFSTWLGWLVGRDQEVVFVADGVEEADLVWACLTVGYDRLGGVLAGGMERWKAEGRAVDSIPLLTRPPTDGRLILDVRQDGEYAAGHVPGSTHLELGSLAAADAPLAGERVLVHCGHGERAMSAASLLRRRGRQDVAVFAGSPAQLAAGRRLDAES